MRDIIIRGMAGNDEIRFFAAITKEMVETARVDHNTSPVATAALGRLLTAGAMMGYMMKGEKDVLTLLVRGDGPLGGITVTSDSHGNVKGYVENPVVCIPANSLGKLDVSKAVGNGSLQIIKDLGLKEPYVGQVALQTGEIAEDLTYYFATSEQTPSAVGLGVLLNKENHVERAGGFIIQVMPNAGDETIAKIEENLKSMNSVTNILLEENNAEYLINEVLKGLDIKITDNLETRFHCNCSKERIEKGLISVGKKELDEMIKDNKDIECHCHFCNKNYIFTPEELKEIEKKAR